MIIPRQEKRVEDSVELYLDSEKQIIESQILLNLFEPDVWVCRMKQILFRQPAKAFGRLHVERAGGITTKLWTRDTTSRAPG